MMNPSVNSYCDCAKKPPLVLEPTKVWLIDK